MAYSGLLQRGTGGGIAHQLGIPAKPTGNRALRPRFGGGAAGGELRIAHLHFQQIMRDIDMNEVAILHEADFAALCRLGRDVPDAGAMRGSGEAAVGNERHLFTQSGADDIGRWGEHFLHPRAAFGAFPADDDHVPGVNFSGQDSLTGFFLRVETDGLAGEVQHRGINAGPLHDCALFGQVAMQHGKAAVLGIGVAKGADNRIIAHLGLGGDLTQRFSADGALGQIHQAFPFGKAVQNGGNAACTIYINHMVGAAGRHFADMRRALGDGVYAVQVIGDAGFVGKGQCVEHGVGGAAHGHIQGKSIVDGRLIYQIARQGAICQSHFHNAACGGFPELFTARIHGRDGAVPGERKPQHFAQAVHGVGREHARAGAAAGAGSLFNGFQLRGGDFVVFVFRYGLEDGVQIGILPRDGIFPREHGAAGSENGGDVHTQGGQNHSRNDFIAVGDTDHAVETVRAEHGFHGVGNQFAAGQAHFHALMPHGDAVADGDGVELKRYAACLADGLFDQIIHGAQVAMPGNDIGIRGTNGNEGFAKVFTGYASRPQKGTVRGFLITTFNCVAAHDHLSNQVLKTWIV